MQQPYRSPARDFTACTLLVAAQGETRSLYAPSAVPPQPKRPFANHVRIAARTEYVIAALHDVDVKLAALYRIFRLMLPVKEMLPTEMRAARVSQAAVNASGPGNLSNTPGRVSNLPVLTISPDDHLGELTTR